MQSDHFAGRQIHDFIVSERIGRGGMATVYRARQLSVNRDVALKTITLDANLSENDEFRRRFEQEATLIATLEHIHILPIYDYGIVDNEVAFIAMRLLRGGSLSDLLRNGPLDFERVTDIFTQIARGLGYAHSKGVIHRDLKPSNILLDDAGNAYLTDFGLAKLVEDSLDLTKSGNILGTPVYMSPEQLRGTVVAARSDIYSMGVILYHMMAGRSPFDSSENNVVSVIYHHLETPPLPPHEYNPEISAGLEAIILRALSKSPDDRYSTIEEMAMALNQEMGRRITITASIPMVSAGGSTDKDSSSPTPGRVTPKAEGISSQSVKTEALAAQGVLTPPTGTPVELPPKKEAWTKNTRLMIVGLAVFCVIVFLAISLLSKPGAPASLPQATILAGQTGSDADAVPTSAEIALAQSRLGENGFIAYITCTLDSEYHATQAREMRELARAHNIAFRIYDSDADRYRQLTQIEHARTEGAMGMIICALDTTLLSSALTSLKEAGIPAVYFASMTDNIYGGVRLTGDSYETGHVAGRSGGEIINHVFDGHARVVVLEYPEMSEIVVRVNGMLDGLSEVSPESEIVARIRGGTRELGHDSMADLIEEGVEFDAILSLNDAGSFGAIDAMTEANISPETVIISSIDGEALAREFIMRDYFIRSTVAIDREQLSRMAVNIMIQLLAGATLPETFLAPPGTAVTRASLEITASIEAAATELAQETQEAG
ncbi:MAG: protein kinase [Anaerolineae bacterium]|nr:protein kinase [Anaerolineae bacterium]